MVPMRVGLGVAVTGTPAHPWREWATPDFDVEGHGPVPAGVDGEALELDTPLRFRSRPAALRVRISKDHPAASPST